MKHIKLFEEFKKAPMYELKPGKVIEDHGQLVVDDAYQLEFLGEYFDSIGYKDMHEYNATATPTKFIDKIAQLKVNFDFPSDGKNSVICYWERRAGHNGPNKIKSYYAAKYTLYDAEREHFNDYFQLEHEYRGHKMKKFGV